MYCSSCRQERLAGALCAACGKPMLARPREVLEQELAHVQFLLEEVSRWDFSEVPKGVRSYLSRRYERQARILLSVLAETRAGAEAPAAAWAEAPIGPEAPVEVEAPVQSEAPAVAWAKPPAVVAWMEVPASAPAEASAPEEDSEAEAVAPAGIALPPVTTEPLFEVPPPRTVTARIVEEASTWHTVWRPFLYESFGWFIGAFLVIAGSLYLAFDSWAGLTSNFRSLLVFGMTAGYSAAFSLCGILLARRGEALAGAGRILGLIGASIAPFAGVALGPIDSFGLEGVPLWVHLPLLLGWGLGAAALVRKPAESFDAPSRPFLQLSLVGTTVMMGLAPLVARLGAPVLWLDVLPCALFFLLSRRPVPEPRDNRALAFVLAAPLYLLLLYAVRLHLALAAAGHPPAFGAYAPLLVFLLSSSLGFRKLEPHQAADPLTLGVTSLQVGCLALAAIGPPPAFFLTAATFTACVYGLSRGELPRLRWLYPTYAGAFLVSASAAQLNPVAAQRGLDSIGARLGYAAGTLPFHYGALSTVPFVLAGVVLAGWLLSRARRSSSPREAAIAEVLLRATAVASPLFVLFGHLGRDMRPSFWTTLGLAAVCVVSGLLFERLYLSIVGAVLTAFLPLSAALLLGPGAASVVSGAVALVFAGLSLTSTRRTRLVFSAVVGWLALLGFLLGIGEGVRGAGLAGLVLCGAAALLVAWNLANPYLLAAAAFGAAAVVPKLASLVEPSLVPLALAASGLGLAALGGLGGRARLLGVPGIAYALLAFQWGLSVRVPWLGLVVLTAAAAVAVASRAFPGVRPLAVLLAGFALLPRVGTFSVWPWMTPALSVALFIPWALGASLVAALRGRSASTLTAGLVALVFPLVAVVVGLGEQPFPLLWGAALAALLTARALHPSRSVSVAALLASVDVLLRGGPLPPLALASGLSLLALLESQRTAFRVLAGGRRFALAASLWALPLLGTACLLARGNPALAVLAGALLLPLVWTRANRQPFFAALAPPLALACVLASDARWPWAPALPLLALLGVRVVAHLPAARRLLLGGEEEAPAHLLSRWLQGALVLVGLVLLPLTEGSPRVLGLLAASLALLPGARPSVRVGASVGLLLLSFPLHPAAVALLLGLGFLTHHRPEALWAFFRAEPDATLRPTTVAGSLALCAASLVHAPTPGALRLLAGVLLAGAFLLSQRWWLTAAVLAFASASLGRTAAHPVPHWHAGAALAFAAVGLASALLSAACQSGRVQRALSRLAARLSPGLDDTWSEPLWVGGLLAAGLPVLAHLVGEGPGGLSLPVALLVGLASLVLMAVRERWMANVATLLLTGVLVAVLPPPWTPAVLSATGLLLCMAGTWLEERDLEVGAALHHGGWVLSLLSVFGLRELAHPGTAACFLFGLGSAWAVVYRRREREVVGWLASLVAVHALLAHVGAVFSTGRGAEFILPYFGALTALLATLALFVAGAGVRRGVGLGFAALALAEVLGGLVLVDAAAGVVREALVACVALAVLFFALVRRAAREEDEAAAFLAQGTLVLGYLAVRLHALAAGLDTTDSLVALVGGALFSGLYVFVHREGAGLHAFRRPALWGAFLFPMAGLLTAPWHTPLVVASLLVGHAAHFAALAAHPSQRGAASLASAGAFNAALLLVWHGTGAGEPQFYVIPAGLSLLVLLRVFREALAPDTRARLRALAITLIYVAGAWKPLLFQDGGAMLLCVFLCVVGVAAGVALRIRSYVYLGSAFLVTCVVANLARFGIRDHRMGAAFLSLLGVGVVGFMVFFTAKREELTARYARVREMLDTWEG